MSKKFLQFFVYSILVLLLFIDGCKPTPPAISQKFFNHYQNKVYNQFDTAAYYKEFEQQLTSMRPGTYTKPITNYYKDHNYEPHFINQFLFDGELETLVTYLSKMREHGLKDSLFNTAILRRDLDSLKANRFTNINHVYPILARLEIESAKSLLIYSSIIQYGLVDPRKLYRRYDIPVKRPDSTLFAKTYAVESLTGYLEQIQPKSAAYNALKKELADLQSGTLDSPKLQQIRTIKLNMERLRWQTPVKEAKYLWVNIPEYQLHWVENGKTIFDMRVCVGQPKPAGYDTLLLRYLKTHDINDKPANHETTMLSSRIGTIQLNPTWNIPTSIAQTEIYSAIMRNPDYLANSGIRVYYHDKRITQPDTIRWGRIARNKIPYQFKQDASDGNALGKFKFIFDNESSIYLHDTPNKKAFFSSYRAVSHGCVRVQDPLKLTEALVNDTNAVDNIRMEVGLAPINPKDTTRYKALQARRSASGFELKSKYIGLKPDMQLFIDYYTAFPDESGKVVYYNDVYRMDAVLEKAIAKYLSK